MGLTQIGVPVLILIILVAFIVFGPKKLPKVRKAAKDNEGNSNELDK